MALVINITKGESDSRRLCEKQSYVVAFRMRENTL